MFPGRKTRDEKRPGVRIPLRYEPGISGGPVLRPSLESVRHALCRQLAAAAFTFFLAFALRALFCFLPFTTRAGCWSPTFVTS